MKKRVYGTSDRQRRRDPLKNTREKWQRKMLDVQFSKKTKEAGQA